MSTVSYLAFHASDGLRDDTELLIKNSQARIKESQIGQMNLVMSKFVVEMLDQFFLDTCEAVQLGPMGTKIVRGGANTLSATANMLIKQLYKKRTNDELYPVIEYIDSTFIRATDASNGKASIVCPIEDSLYDNLMHDIGEIRKGNFQHSGSLTELMLEVNDAAMVGYAETPIGMLKMNFVAKKVTNTGLEAGRSTSKMVINKVFRTLEDDQMGRLADYVESFFITAPQK
ncbi:MAG: hypothetical protein JKY67_01320 [Pseudomonadales bacterium]|nr:hypothetical protein [Pseudomonadales bacterium]